MPNEEYNDVEGGLGIFARRVIAYVVLILLTFLCLFWFYLLFINSTRSHAELTRGFTLIPSKFLVKNINGVLHGTQPIFRGMLNSFIVATTASVLCVYFSAMTAYAIYVYDFKAKKAIFTFILAVMMIPTQVTALGFIKLITRIGMNDSFLPLIIPAIAAPATFYYMHQYMESALPHAIVEAARIDGSPEWKTFNSISLPIMKPAIAVQMIFCFVANWNNYFTPALVLHTDTKKTLPILIAQLRSADFLKFDMGQVYVSIALSIAPVIVVYLCLSRYIVGGVAVGSVKG
ncbi:MAG: carbohydrate ABC transporter permease [Lachnospiraceae bacterium]|nr:carbohydrate ABC transporter permease [Candidatus Colinaster scatohippi]